MATSTISYLFDRGVKSNHPWSAYLRADTKRTSPYEQAAYTNLSMDWRIDAAAESHLVKEFSAKFSSQTSIVDTIPQYFTATYCKPVNNVKFLSDVVSMPRHRELLHIGSLWGMLNRVVRSVDARSQLQIHFALTYGDSRLIPATGNLKPDEVENVANVMQNGNEQDFRETIELLHELLGSRQPFWWATFWQEAKSIIDDAESLVDALGMGEFIDGDMLLVYRYKASDISLVCRPTAVEANNYAFHYPSPQTLTTGLSMPLNDRLDALSEMIHHPLKASVAATAVVHKLLPLKAGKLEQTKYNDLATHRARHRTMLNRDHAHKSSNVTGWLNRHANCF